MKDFFISPSKIREIFEGDNGFVKWSSLASSDFFVLFFNQIISYLIFLDLFSKIFFLQMGLEKFQWEKKCKCLHLNSNSLEIN